MKFLSNIVVFLLFFLSSNLYADELRLSLNEAKRQGFVIQKKFNAGYKNSQISKSIKRYKNHELAWPFELPYKNGFIGNNFAQYQPYALPGYHGGSDMVLEKDSWMYAPVNGILEAGHYAYTDNPDGSRIKHWKPWPQSGDPSYFELAVIDNDGNRFELHHVDKATLPSEVVAGLNQGKFSVKMGMKLGRVVDWGTPFHYEHVHVNIHDRDGTWYNPEYFFKLLPDTISPQCRILALYSNNKTAWVEPGFKITPDLLNFVLIVSDQKSNNNFSQAPLYYEIRFYQGGLFFWDFRKSLTSSNSKFADIRQVYSSPTKLPSGLTMRQPNGYYPNDVKFLVNLPLPEDKGDGSFQIIVEDIAGNSFTFKN